MQRVQKWQEPVWVLIIVLTPLFVNLWVEQQFEASKVWLLRTLVWLLALLWMSGWLVGMQWKPLPKPIQVSLYSLSAILLLSSFLSHSVYIALFGSLDRANGVLTQLTYFLFFICMATRIDWGDAERLLHSVALTAVPITLFGLAQATGWQSLSVLSDASSPLTTTLGRANFTGAYLSMLLPLLVTAAQSAKIAWYRLLYTLLCLLTACVIGLTQARAAWIAAAVATGTLFWLQSAPHWSRQARWLSGLGGVVGISGGLLIVLREGIASGGSIAARWVIWQASLRLLWPRLWLGYGADTLDLIFPSVYPPQLVYYQGRGVAVDRAHNWLLDWSLSYGVVATAVLLLLLFFILRRGWQQLLRKDVHHASQNRWLAACMAGVGAQLVGNLFLFEVASTAVLFWLLLAIVTATTNQQSTISTPFVPSWAGKVLLGLCVLLVGWGVWQVNGRSLLADAASWRGTQAVGRGEEWVALRQYETAVKLQPHRAEYRIALALTAAELGQYSKAVREMNHAMTQRPTDPVVYTHLAAIYGREGVEKQMSDKIVLANAMYDQAIRVAPTIGVTYRQYAEFALQVDNTSLAIEQAEQAVRLDATDGKGYGVLGWVYLKNGRLDDARASFDQAVKWEPNSADFYLGLATVHFQQGNLFAAQQMVAQSLQLDPTYPPALTLQQQTEP